MTTWSPPDPVLAARLVDRFGDGARGWLDGLPALVSALAARWSLTPVAGVVLGGGSAVVVRCRVANGVGEGKARDAVLKLTPDPSLAAAEADALAAWASTGAVPELWARDDAAGALLMEAVGDGATIVDRATTAVRPGGLDGDDPAAAAGEASAPAAHRPDRMGGDGPAATAGGDALPCLARIGALVRRLHTVPADTVDVPPIAERVAFVFDLWERRRAASDAARARISYEAMARGRACAEALARDGGAPTVLLHGDLHPGNVLDAGAARGLVAIDPRPCAGDPAFDAIDWVLWRIGEPMSGPVGDRIAALAPFAGGDPARLGAWCAAFAPLLAVSAAIRRGRDDHLAALLAFAEG